MAQKKKKKKPVKRKFKTITFKLSVRQKKSLDKCSKAQDTTPLKLIKHAIEVFTCLPDDMPPPPPAPTIDNQLDLFVEAELASKILQQTDGK